MVDTANVRMRALMRVTVDFVIFGLSQRLIWLTLVLGSFFATSDVSAQFPPTAADIADRCFSQHDQTLYSVGRDHYIAHGRCRGLPISQAKVCPVKVGKGRTCPAERKRLITLNQRRAIERAQNDLHHCLEFGLRSASRTLTEPLCLGVLNRLAQQVDGFAYNDTRTCQFKPANRFPEPQSLCPSLGGTRQCTQPQVAAIQKRVSVFRSRIATIREFCVPPPAPPMAFARACNILGDEVQIKGLELKTLDGLSFVDAGTVGRSSTQGASAGESWWNLGSVQTACETGADGVISTSVFCSSAFAENPSLKDLTVSIGYHRCKAGGIQPPGNTLAFLGGRLVNSEPTGVSASFEVELAPVNKQCSTGTPFCEPPSKVTVSFK